MRELKKRADDREGDYTDEEWVRLRRAPFVTGLAITIADPGEPIEMAKESVATLKTASTSASQEELLVAVSQDIFSMMNQRQNPIGDFKPESSALADKWVLDELRAVGELLTAKAKPERQTPSADGCCIRHRLRPMQRRRAASWALGGGGEPGRAADAR
jgi:hypothetical protein